MNYAEVWPESPCQSSLVDGSALGINVIAPHRGKNGGELEVVWSGMGIRMTRLADSLVVYVGDARALGTWHTLYSRCISVYIRTFQKGNDERPAGCSPCYEYVCAQRFLKEQGHLQGDHSGIDRFEQRSTN